MFNDNEMVGYIATFFFLKEMDQVLPCEEFKILLGSMRLMGDMDSIDAAKGDTWRQCFAMAQKSVQAGTIPPEVIWPGIVKE